MLTRRPRPRNPRPRKFRNRSYTRHAQHGPRFEAVEPRLMLSSAPFFVTELTDQFLTNAGALTLGIDAGDADGDALTITAVSSNPNIEVYVPQGNRYARLHFSNIVQGTTVFTGSILVQLFDDRSPTATDRFVQLATDTALGSGGDPFYTDVLVHRVIPGFVIQTGDAVNGNGTGGSPLGAFPDVFDPILSYAGPGALGMANSGPNTNDSQWFITAGATPHLNQKHMIFGQLISGQDTFDKIINTPRDGDDRPLSPPVLESVEILTEEQNPQDGTVTIRAVDGFFGEAHVIIKLDDGTNVTEKEIKVTALGNSPVITPVGPLVADAANPLVFNVTDDGNAALTLEVLQTFPVTGTVTPNPAAGTFTFNVPAGFNGLSRLILSAHETGFEAHATDSLFYVLSQDAGSPEVLGRAAANRAGVALGTQQVGDLLFVANGQRGLEIWNIANEANPVRLGTSSTLGLFRDVQVVNNVAFVVFNNGPVGNPSGIIAFDVSNPADISFISGAFTAANGAALDLVVEGNFAYVAAGPAGLTVFNIAQMLDGDPTTNNITIVGALKAIEAGVTLGSADGVAKLGNTLYISDGVNGGVIVMNAPTPTTMTFIGRILTPIAPFGIAAAANRLYVVDQSSGLQVFDITNPTNIGLMDQIAVPGLPAHVSVVGSLAIVGNNNGFTFIDVGNPEDLQQVYRFDGPFGSGVASGNEARLALPLGSDGVVLMDTANLQKPVFLTTPPAQAVEGQPFEYVIDTTVLGDAALTLLATQLPAWLSFQDLGDGSGRLFGTPGTANVGLHPVSLSATAGTSTEQAFTLSVAAADGAFVQNFANSITVIDDNGVEVTITVKNATGRLFTAEANGGRIGRLEIVGANDKTTVTIKTKGGDATLGAVFIDGPAKSFLAKTTDLDGDFTALGAVLTIQLDDLLDVNVITIGSSNNPRHALTFIADEVTDASLFSGIPIKALTVTFWHDTDAAADVVESSRIDKLTAKGNKKENKAGDFEAGLALSGQGAAKATLGKTKIAGTASGAWNVTGHGTGLDAMDLGPGFDATFSGDLAGLKLGNNAAGSLAANSLKKFDAKGTSTLDLTLAGVNAPRGVALGGAKVGDLGGTWDVGAAAGNVAATNISAWTAVFDGPVKGVKVKDSIDGMNLTADAVLAVAAKNAVTDSAITLTRPISANPKDLALKTFKAGSTDGLAVRAQTHLGKFQMGLAFDTLLFAGVQDALNTLPGGPEDFISQASIADVKIKGVRGVATWLNNLHIAAASVGKISVGFASPDNGGTPYGVAARTIGSVQYQDNNVKTNARSPQDIANLQPIGDLVIRVV